MISNYRYLIGEDTSFINHFDLYFYIIFAQIIETIINFVTIQSKERKTFKHVVYDYVTGLFLLDLIGILPYHNISPKLVFIRLIRVFKFKQYHKYFEQHIMDLTSQHLSSTS